MLSEGCFLFVAARTWPLTGIPIFRKAFQLIIVFNLRNSILRSLNLLMDIKIVVCRNLPCLEGTGKA